VPHTSECVWHHLFVTGPISMCDIPDFFAWRDSFTGGGTGNAGVSKARRVWEISRQGKYVTCLMLICDMTHVDLRHNSCLCVILFFGRSVWVGKMCSQGKYVTWLIYWSATWLMSLRDFFWWVLFELGNWVVKVELLESRFDREKYMSLLQKSQWKRLYSAEETCNLIR